MCKYGIAVVSSAGQLERIKVYSKQPSLEDVTVGQLKKNALKSFSKSGYFLGEVRLILNGKPLDDDCASLSDCEINFNSVVQMVTKVHGG